MTFNVWVQYVKLSPWLWLIMSVLWRQGTHCALDIHCEWGTYYAWEKSASYILSIISYIIICHFLAMSIKVTDPVYRRTGQLFSDGVASNVGPTHLQKLLGAPSFINDQKMFLALSMGHPNPHLWQLCCCNYSTIEYKECLYNTLCIWCPH